MSKKLTEKQEAFLDALLNECNGNVKAAMLAAGYSPSTKTFEVVEPLKDEIIARTKTFLASNAPKAMLSMVEVLHDPNALGNKNKINAAKDIMDRAGLMKKDEADVGNAANVMFILPAKRADNAD